LESLKAIAALGFLSDNVEDGVYKFGSLCVVTFGPVVSGTTLSEDEVVWAEDLTEWSGSDGVHSSGLKIDKNGTWDVFATGGFIVVYVDSFKLKIAVSVVGTSWVDSVFVGDDLPELGTDLVTALTSL
jgi:predicted glutamine amidotransferase